MKKFSLFLILLPLSFFLMATSCDKVADPTKEEELQAVTEGIKAYQDENYVTAFRRLSPFAGRGNAMAQLYLGHMYYNGHGVTQNGYTAFKWYLRSAEQGNAVAQMNVGYMYDSGYGVKQDYTEAVKWFRKSANQGNDYGLNNLGEMYRDGFGVARNYLEAFKWFTLAAGHGFHWAQYNLAELYYRGQGVKKDLIAAYMWVSVAIGNAPSDISSTEKTKRQSLKNNISREMSATEIQQASQLFTACKNKSYKNC